MISNHIGLELSFFLFSNRGCGRDNFSNTTNGAHSRDRFVKVVQMSINASGEDVRVSTAS